MNYKDWPVESTAFIGPLGGLVPIPISQQSSVDMKPEAGWIFRKTVSGSVHAQRAVNLRREWKVKLEEYPAQYLAPLNIIATGGYGPGPFAWVTPQAQASNLLSRDDSMMVGINNANKSFVKLGPKMLDGELLGQAIYSPEQSPGHMQLSQPIPLNPLGGPITARAWIMGNSAYIYFSWVMESGEIVMNPSGTWPVPSDSNWHKVSLTRTPPTGAVGAILKSDGAFGVAGTQVVWGDREPASYAIGEGCTRAVISEAPATYGQIDDEGNWAVTDFTVTEVG